MSKSDRGTSDTRRKDSGTRGWPYSRSYLVLINELAGRSMADVSHLSRL
jgi:hypothetical protein